MSFSAEVQHMWVGPEHLAPAACIVAGCGGTISRRQWCRKHYERWRHHGTTDPAKHGLSKTPEYQAWSSMIARCENKNNTAYKHYGKRGITVCLRWRSSFLAFLVDMGKKPTPEHTLDRRHVDGNYGPDNCRWATRLEQSRNTRNNHWITANGERMLLVDWAARLHATPSTILTRIKCGWSPERAVLTPIMRRASV